MEPVAAEPAVARVVETSREPVKRPRVASFALVVVGLLWALLAVVLFRVVGMPVEDHGQYWYGIEPMSPERASEWRLDGILVLLVMLAIAGAHIAVAVLHARKPWGRWLTAATAAIYLVGTQCLFMKLVSERDPRAACVCAVGGGVFVAILLYGAFGRARPSCRVTSG